MRVMIVGVVLLLTACDSRAPDAPQTTSIPAPKAANRSPDICGLQRVGYNFRGLKDEFLVGNAGSEPLARQALFAKRRWQVNTDGAPTSYHSVVLNADDPKVGALNIICNAVVRIRQTRWLGFLHNGAELACHRSGFRVSPEYMHAFEAIKDNDWHPAGGYEIAFNFAILAGKPRPQSGLFGWFRALFSSPIPCLQPDGFFVSMTKGTHRAAGQCDQQAYFDATKIKGLVLPQNWFADWKSGRVARWGSFRPGDVVVALRPAEAGGPETFVYGVVGDAGPMGNLGEASVRFNWEILGKHGNIEDEIRTYKDVARIDTDTIKVPFLVLEDTASAFNGDITPDTIEAVAAREFSKWGGAARFKSCLDQL
jgi:hypothetical protein